MLSNFFKPIANNSNFETEVSESDIDHIHFLIHYIPRLSTAQIVRRLKQESTGRIWLLHSVSLQMRVLVQKCVLVRWILCLLNRRDIS